MTGAIESLVAGLPGWSDAGIVPLAGGTGARAYRLDAGGRSAVLKLDAKLRRPPYNSRAEEADVQQRAAALGFAPRVLWHSPEGIMTEWLDGTSLASGDTPGDAVLVELARLLRSLHSLPPTGLRYELAAWANHYRSELEASGRVDDSLARDAGLLAATTLAGPWVTSHNDCVPANVIRGDSMRLIDFEYARDNSPLFDLATFIVEAGLSDAGRDVLTRAYFDGRRVPDDDLDQAIEAYRPLVRLWRACRSPAVA